MDGYQCISRFQDGKVKEGVWRDTNVNLGSRMEEKSRGGMWTYTNVYLGSRMEEKSRGGMWTDTNASSSE